MKQSIIRLLIVLVLFSFTKIRSVSAQDADQPPTVKKRVAVVDFEFGAVQSWWGGEWNIGKGIADLLISQLVNNGAFSIVERRALDKVLQEQQMSNSDRFDAGSATKIGKILGVDAILMGSVTQFGFEDKKVGVGGAILNSFLSGAIGGFSKKNTKAIVIVDARIVDTSTGEILAVATGKGESKRGSFTGFGAAGSSGGAAGAIIDMGSSNFQNTIIGEATRLCIDSLVTEIIKLEAKIHQIKIQLNGRVADVANNILIVNIGSDDGAMVGAVLSVERLIREIKDPVSNAVIRQITEKLGTIKLTDVDPKSAVGTFQGSGLPKVGDLVKTE